MKEDKNQFESIFISYNGNKALNHLKPLFIIFSKINPYIEDNKSTLINLMKIKVQLKSKNKHGIKLSTLLR